MSRNIISVVSGLVLGAALLSQYPEGDSETQEHLNVISLSLWDLQDYHCACSRGVCGSKLMLRP
jgi:hypothetical protein